MSGRFWLAYAALVWLRPCLPSAWPTPALDLVWLAACRLRGQDAESLGRALLPLALTDALLGAPEPWLRWLVWLCLVWLPSPSRPRSLLTTCLGCGLTAAVYDLVFGSEAGLLHAAMTGLVAAAVAPLLAPRLPSRRASGWGSQPA